MLSEFRTQILEQVRDGYIDDQTTRDLSQFISILNTAGDELGNNLLIRASNNLDDSIDPDYPFNFQDEERIAKAFKLYKRSFKIAVGRDQRAWIKIIQKAAKGAFYDRSEDGMSNERYMMKMVNQAKQLQEKMQEQQLLENKYNEK